ncbi:hypothetical protein DSO57_1006696 [Entomophthora muscae]|uniref:Uncharacterized protein n=1 Tax=Entomophthora muscae TaxID=34485 RepID=A0ACC2UGK2_9FUNG|nr:hypothetical protein DSO57_1006696 [Entomophthora muscae]
MYDNHVVCDGALVLKDTVVTAASCLAPKEREYHVLLLCENGIHMSAIRQIIKHPFYFGTMLYDVAIIKLDSLAFGSSGLELDQPISLNNPSLLVGWG